MAEDGAPPPDDLLLEVYTDLDANREANFLVYVIPPGANGVYTGIDVKADIHLYPGVTNADGIAQATQAVTDWLNPVNWGQVPGTTTSQTWATDNKVRITEAIEHINRATGVFWVANVQIKKATDPVGSFAAADITLSGAVPMPKLGNAPIFSVV
jgi:hypothetical protein